MRAALIEIFVTGSNVISHIRYISWKKSAGKEKKIKEKEKNRRKVGLRAPMVKMCAEPAKEDTEMTLKKRRSGKFVSHVNDGATSLGAIEGSGVGVCCA